MPGTPTPHYTWPLPALSDPPDGPGQMAALGNAIDATVFGIDGRVADTGNVNPIAVAFAAGWAASIYPIAGRRLGKLCVVHLSAKRTGAAITPNATGNIATDVLMLTINDARFYPQVDTTSLFTFSNSVGGQGGAYFTGTNLAGFNLGTFTPGCTINTNDTITAPLAYVAA